MRSNPGHRAWAAVLISISFVQNNKNALSDNTLGPTDVDVYNKFLSYVFKRFKDAFAEYSVKCHSLDNQAYALGFCGQF